MFRNFAFKTVAVGLVALLTGCVAATPVITPSGQQGFTIDCSPMNDIGQCYKKAGELCGSNGYEVIAQNNQPASFFSPANRTMVICCKNPNVK
jgi:hypothetical protein